MRANTVKHLKMINLQRRHFQSLISPCPALLGAELKRSSRVCLRLPRSSHLQPLSQTPGVWLVGLPWLTIERASKIKILWGASLFSKSLRRGLENWWLHFSLFQYTFLMLTLLYPVGTTPFPRTVLKLHGCKVDVLDWGWLCDSGVVGCSIRSGCLAKLAFKQISV